MLKISSELLSLTSSFTHQCYYDHLHCVHISYIIYLAGRILPGNLSYRRTSRPAGDDQDNDNDELIMMIGNDNDDD